MKRFIKLSLATLIISGGLLFAAPNTPSVNAINVFDGACEGESGTTGGGTGGGAQAGGSGSSSAICGAAKQDNAQDIVKNVINAILIVLGMISVVMIVIGGIRYTTSNGDSSQIQAAKNTILYAVVGLIIAILSYAIVNFVINAFI